MVVYDLSQPIESDMPHFPGDPSPAITPVEGPGPWRVTRCLLGSHTGTHIDAPSHYFPGMASITDHDVARFVGRGFIVDVRGIGEDEPIRASRVKPQIEPWAGGFAVLRTDWSQWWGHQRYFRHPYLSPGATRLLLTWGVSIVGIDTLNVDSTVQAGDDVHRMLLGNEVLIVENLANLARLDPGTIYTFSFLPLRIQGIDGSPIRATAW